MIDRLCRWIALAGGGVLLALIVMTCLSILGRSGFTLAHLLDLRALSGLRPIRGDYELIEIGSAIAVFAFMPWAVLSRAHARVALWRRGAGALDRFWDWAMVAVMALIAWRLALGLAAKYASGDSSFLLRLPLWWGYALCLIGAAISVIAALAVAMTAKAARQGGEG